MFDTVDLLGLQAQHINSLLTEYTKKCSEIMMTASSSIKKACTDAITMISEVGIKAQDEVSRKLAEIEATARLELASHMKTTGLFCGPCMFFHLRYWLLCA